jgi:hypothetical protein
VIGGVDLVSLEEFLPEVEIEANGVSTDLALWNIRDACIEFAEETSFMQRTEMFATQRGVRDYFPTPLKGEQIVKVTGVCIGGANVFRNGVAMGSPFSDPWGLEFSPPYRVTLPQDFSEDCANCLSVSYKAMPTRDACEVDAQFHRRYHSAIVYGALSRLLSMPRSRDQQHAFSNPPAGRMYADKFQREKARAKTDVALEFMGGSRSTFSRAQIRAGF